MSAEREPFDAATYREIEPGYYDRVHRRARGIQWFWHEHRFRAVERALPRPVGRILDLGCGPGTFLGRLPVPFGAATGVDLSGAQIEYARRSWARPGLDFRQGDVRNLAGGPAFDVVVAIELLEHLPPRAAGELLVSIRRLLRPGGVALFTTPNYRSLWPLLERLVSRIGPVDYRVQHLNPYTAPRLRRNLEAAGFAAVTVETFFVAAPFLAPLGAGLARAVLRLESRWLPGLGAELLARAVRPPTG